MKEDQFKRVILHLDLDCFYAQVEHNRLKVPLTIPLAVQQWNGLIAVNYAARDAGIKRHVTVSEALMKCPQLRLVHVPTYSITTTTENEKTEPNEIVAIPQYRDEIPAYRSDGTRLPPNPPDPSSNKACLEPYRQASMAIFRLIRDWCSKLGQGVIFEKGGLDEAFIDITEEVENQLIEEFDQKYTMLRDELEDIGNEELEMEALENLKLYNVQWIDNELDFSGLGENAISDFDIQKETESLVEKMRMTVGKLRIWKGAQISKELRSRLLNELNFVASIGIAPNKMLAKLVSALYKPDRQTRIEPAGVSQFMQRVPFEKIRMMGGKMGKSVLKNNKKFSDESENEDFDFQSDTEDVHIPSTTNKTQETVKAADLWPLTLSELTDRVGDRGTAVWIYQLIRGHDPSPLTPRSLSKSFMSAKSFRPAVRSWPELHDWMIVLVGELWSRIGEERENSARWPSTITLHWKSFKLYNNNNKPNNSNKNNTWNNTGALSKSCEFPYASSIPSQATRPDFLSTVFRLLTPHTDTLFPLSRMAVSVSNFKGGLDINGEVSARVTRVDQYFKKQAEIVHELPASMDRFFVTDKSKSLSNLTDKSADSISSSCASKISVFEMLLATVKTPKSNSNILNIFDPTLKCHNTMKRSTSNSNTKSKSNTTSNSNCNSNSNSNNNNRNSTILKFFKHQTDSNSKGSAVKFYHCDEHKCKFKCQIGEEKIIQEHSDYHLAINLSRNIN